MADQWIDIPMLARTHGQPATPTLVGKELMVFVERLENQIQLFSYIPFTGKFSLIDVYLALAADHIIMGYDHSGDKFVDVGKPENIAVAESLFP